MQHLLRRNNQVVDRIGISSRTGVEDTTVVGKLIDQAAIARLLCEYASGGYNHGMHPLGPNNRIDIGSLPIKDITIFRN